MIKRALGYGKRAAGPLARLALGQGRELPPEVWGLRRNARGELSIHGITLAELGARFGSPLMVFDGAALDRNAAAFMKSPGVPLDCFFSYKTTPVPGVLRRLHARGIGAEVISEYEQWLAQQLAVPGPRTVTNGPGRSLAALRSAIEMDALIYVNHREEIPLLAGFARELNKKARVGVRVVAPGGWGGQFGEPIHDGSAMRAYRELLADSCFDVCALHVHRGIEICTTDELAYQVAEVFAFAAELRRELGVLLRIVDLGGSLGCPSSPKLTERDQVWRPRLRLNLPAPDLSTRLSIADYVTALGQAVRSECARHDLPIPTINLEPGRAMTGNAAFLLCSVTGLKASGAQGFTHAILDAGVNIAEPVRGEFHQILHAQAARPGSHHYRLVGPICTPMDTLRWSYTSSPLAVGDQLAIMDAGAYFIPFSTSFSFPQPAVVMVDENGAELIRRAEDFKHMASRDLL